MAATAELADGAKPAERGRLLGFADLLSSRCGAALTALAGLALARVGIEAICVVGRWWRRSPRSGSCREAAEPRERA